jgi:antagonist of KipI
VSLRVLRPGLLTTVQDLGRPGWQRFGVVAGGALDDVALRVANLLVGNAAGDAALEATLIGPTLELLDDHLIALGGADLGATLDGAPLPVWRPVAARAGSLLIFESRRRGCRAYIAVAGGIDVPRVLGGRGTDLRGRFGGLAGRALDAGDTLPAGPAGAASERTLRALLAADQVVAGWGAGPSLLPAYDPAPLLRVLPGPEFDLFRVDARAALVTEPFEVTSRSDRMGYRLSGPALALDRPHELVSSPVARGTVQVPPGGEPIILMADRQTTGGYPRIAAVIDVDIPLLAQAPPGTAVRFQLTTLAEAQALRVARARDLRLFAEALRLRGG